MLIDVSKDLYRKHFNTDPNPYISEAFIGLVEHKTEKVVRLMRKSDESIGLIAGIKDNTLNSPFSAPFGGFHYSHEHLSYDVIFDFISALKNFVEDQKLDSVTITLPPDLYQQNMNAKLINSFKRQGFNLSALNITNWVDLPNFDGTWIKNYTAQNCRKAIRNQLSFHVVTDEESMKSAYDIIYKNRTEQGRNIHMTFDDILKVNSVIPVDFLLVRDKDGNNMAAGIFYRGNEKIIQAIFLGDGMVSRNLGVMDFMFMNIYELYKKMNFKYIDFGVSSSDGEPNAGLIRFKEIHNCTSSLRYTLSWSPNES